MKFRDLIENDTALSEVQLTEEEVQLAEAKFSEKNIEKVVKLYSKIMGKRMGGAFKPLGFETYKRKWGPGKGFRVINNTGAMLRFNWDTKLAKDAMYELTSMDYWANNNTDFQFPTRTVKFGSELNVVQVLDKVTDALLTGSLSEAEDLIESLNTALITEAPSKEQRSQFADDMGFPKSASTSAYHLRKAGEKRGMSEQVEVFLGAKETNSFETELKTVEKKFTKQVYADPETIFDDVEDLLGLVASKKWRTLVVCGEGGIGKTYGITEGPRSLKALLGSEGDKWTYHSGVKASPLAFYKTLFQERDKVIVFDEADAILKHSEIVMMLKPVLDTSGSNTAEYLTGTYNMVGKTEKQIAEYSSLVQKAIEQGATVVKAKTKRLYDPFTDDLESSMSEYDVMLPSKFKFSGGMVFISNMKSAEIEQAIMSRSIFVDIYLAERDVLKRIETIGYAIADHSPTVTRDKVNNVMEVLGSGSSSEPEEEITYMTPEYARKSKKVTVRALQLGLLLQDSGLSNWARLASLYA